MFKSLPKKKHPYTVCYFQRSRLSVFIPARKEVAALDFPPTILADVTVVDQEQFRKAITKLLAQYKVDAGPVLVVLAADVCFVQEVEVTETKDKKSPEDVVKELRSSMPFSNVFARVIHVGKRQLAVALNREFYEPLLAVFREEGFDVTTLVPEFILSQPIGETGLTPVLAIELAAAVEKFEAFDLLESQSKPKMITTSAQTPEEKKRTLLLAGVFIVLTLVLVGVWWWVNKPTAKPTPVVPVIPVVEAPVPTLVPIPLEPEATESAATNSAQLLLDDATGSAQLPASSSGNPRATTSTASPALTE